MSYYPPHAMQQPGAPGAYPYAAPYQPPNPGMYGHPQTPGAYSYPTSGAYSATGYSASWAYPYNYYQHHQPTTPAARPTVSTPSATTQAHTATPTAPNPQRATFSVYTPSYTRENATSTISAAAGGGTRGYRKQSNFKGLFTKELRSLMYGFGDDRNPANDTVNVMEEILVEYIADVCQTALAPTRKSRLSIEDLRRALSRPADAKKLARMEELLFMQEDIKRARAQFDDSEINQSSALQS
ncbi:TFIID-18kDa-domain-containing protein [Dentipellis sp. KUC8613]|nr:TFIID-18kDa-domain-containing protein [Dentipellis sp. KUC8613]